MMTRMKANCGCGWTRSNYEITDEQVLNTDIEDKKAIAKLADAKEVLAEAEQHRKARGHVVEVRGEVR